MYGSDLNWVAVGSAGVGIGLVTVIAFNRRRTRRRGGAANAEVEKEPKRRIDVVAIDAPTPASKREAKS